MTVSSTSNRTDATGTGSTASYPFTFPIQSTAEVKVVTRDLTGVETVLTNGVDYTVTLASSPAEGGTVVLTAGNLTSGYAIAIVPNEPLTQSTQVRNQGVYALAQAESDQDRRVIADQQQQEQLDRSLHLPVSEAGTAGKTTLPFDRASTFLAFDASKNPIAAVGVASAPATTFGASLIAANDAPTVRGILGATTVGGALFTAASSDAARQQLGPGVTNAVTTLAALRALTGTDLRGTALMQGYGASGDGGGGLFVWNSTDTSADNSGTIIQPTSGGTGRWNRVSPYGAHVDVAAFGALGDGTDQSAAIQRAVNALDAAGGGTLWFNPKGIYGVGTTIDVKSKSAIYLVSRMGPSSGPSYGIADLSFSGYFKPTTSLANGIVRFAAPSGAASRVEHGGGGCIGLSFADPANRTTSIYAAINAADFNLSVIRDCHFHWLLGSAIVLDQAVMASVDRCVVRYCGDTSKPALLGGVTKSGPEVVQSTTIRDCRFEVNYSAAYVSLPSGGNGGNNKVIGCGFESETATAATQQTFIDDNQAGNAITACHFNRNSARALNLNGTDGAVSACLFYGDSTAMSVPTIDLTSSSRRYQLQGLTLRGYGAQTGNCLKDAGQYNSVANCTVATSGNVDLASAVGSTLTAVKVLSPITTQTYAITIGDSCQAVGCYVDGGSAGTFKGFGLAAVSAPRAVGCVAKNLNNTDAFTCSSSNGSLIGCDGFNLGTGKVFGTIAAGAEVIGSPLALRGTANIDPASLAAGAGVVLATTITVPGAAVGDGVVVSSNGDSSGLILSGVVTAASTVKVSMYNPTGGAVDLGSCTFTARVLK